ncbi:MAG TPA: hypothetical protein VK136_10480 [Bacillota bacterium]|nr:hypothetical protein [Bacillota bacterium]
MSEEKNKKVIHVKDLTIKADNVYFEQPPPRPRPRWNPFFFGPPRMAKEEAEQKNGGYNDAHSSDSEKERQDRKPFSWI